MDWKFIALLIGIGGGLLGGASSWMALGLPTLATRGYVDSSMKPWIIYGLKTRRLANSNAKFAWEKENPRPYSAEVLSEIDRLRREIRDIDQRIAEMER